MQNTRLDATPITAFTTDDPDRAIRLRDLLGEAGIPCQLTRGLLVRGDVEGRDLIELRTDESEMETASQIIDASQAIGRFSALNLLPPVETPLAPAVPSTSRLPA